MSIYILISIATRIWDITTYPPKQISSSNFNLSYVSNRDKLLYLAFLYNSNNNLCINYHTLDLSGSKYCLTYKSQIALRHQYLTNHPLQNLQS